jgi:hypothetical protein
VTKLDLFLRIVSTVATLIIGLAASILAYQQYKISKSKLKFDLFEKRLALFIRAREYTSKLAWESLTGFETYDVAKKFYNDTLEHRFLFDDNVSS